MYYKALEHTFLGLDQLIVNFIVKVKEILPQIIVFSCTPHWQQEDIAALAQLITEQHPNFIIKELNQGLDRATYLIANGENDYWLHFECYSQSIWLEPLSDHTDNQLETLFDHLKKSQTNDE